MKRWRSFVPALVIVATLSLPPNAPAHHTRGHNYTVAKRAVCKVFGSQCANAMYVVRCETGGTYSVWAGYGKHQYYGLFQMGSWARANYGHGWNAWAQARAAYKLWRAHGWSQWQCSPHGAFRD